MENLEKLSFVGETNTNKLSVEVKKLDDLNNTRAKTAERYTKALNKYNKFLTSR